MLASVFEGCVWTDVLLRSQALPELGPHMLLHAGPPLVGRPPAAILQAAAQALVFEGLAGDLAQAKGLLAVGKALLMPAQDLGLVTPLAQVVSASMPVAVVRRGDALAYAALVEGGLPALRFGTEDPAARQRLHTVRDAALERIAGVLRAAPLALAPVVQAALEAGDECHGRTGAANQALVARLAALAAPDQALLAGIPSFVLPLLMAAACCRLRAQREGIAAIGGNGQAFGVRLHGETGWRSCAAQPPRGVRLPGHAATPALGAIGDSAVIDACGLGGQALAFAPLLVADWAGLLPADALQRRHAIVDPATGLIDPARMHASGTGALIDLAVLDHAGAAGLIGRGFYEIPTALFHPLPKDMA